jgi:type IV secretory pathway VirB10-like protein
VGSSAKRFAAASPHKFKGNRCGFGQYAAAGIATRSATYREDDTDWDSSGTESELRCRRPRSYVPEEADTILALLRGTTPVAPRVLPPEAPPVTTPVAPPVPPPAAPPVTPPVAPPVELPVEPPVEPAAAAYQATGRRAEDDKALVDVDSVRRNVRRKVFFEAGGPAIDGGGVNVGGEAAARAARRKQQASASVGAGDVARVGRCGTTHCRSAR